MITSAHPERKTAFEKFVYQMGLVHGRCKPASPWQNGIIERSHRTDNEELFHAMRFEDAETRRYQLRLWEYYYNTVRPHQSLGGLSPIDVYKTQYRWHAMSRMLI